MVQKRSFCGLAKYAKCVSGWGSALDPAGGAQDDPVTRLKLSMGPIRGPYSLYLRHVRASVLPKNRETKYSYNAYITEIYLKMTMSHWKGNES